ncbi:MAG: tetratricopeptide repeat protein [Phycisphaerae bacterium]|nr:tetratricopeptide repeat protein [Phycisphaerae bacterium]NIS53668.1 tetratricopeptide repeat protein [Phycisphaerae bacterium]NIU11224.1 tetratricopeptide repeat protein [Phycisphaerae bacterium]NIU59079.1 tetratricopeptide repeat protein [Phycisphaerae bacterium]NIW95398.1 tetratricopeptide repeat protein [Phycisphaerae bacterium]
MDAVKLPKDISESAHSQQLNKIIGLLGDRKLDAAREQIRLYLFENPSCTLGRMAATVVLLQKNQIQNAIEELNSVYLRQPNNTMALYALGHCYERLDKEAQAIEFYQDCLKFKRYLQLPAQRLAAIYFKNGQLEKTIQQYELLKNEYPDDISTLVTLGHLYIASQEYTKAIETFNTAILLHPGNFYVDDDDIDLLIADGQFYDALEHIQDMMQNQPDRPDLIAKCADVLAMLGSTEEAVAQYEEAIRLCPDFLEATIKLGTQYLQLNAEQAAAMQFNRAVEINDKIVDAYIGLSTASKLASDTSYALATLSLAAAIQPNSSFLFAETATLQFKASFGQNFPCPDGHDAASLIEAVICAHKKQIISRPYNPDLHYRLGVLLMSTARLKDAILSFHTALKINPTYHRANSKLAVCLFETNQKKLALQQLNPPEYLDNDTLQLHYKIAMLYCDKLKFASSLINLDRLLEENFTRADATVNISIVLQNLGLLDRVTATWDNLSDTTSQAIGPNHPYSPGNPS